MSDIQAHYDHYGFADGHCRPASLDGTVKDLYVHTSLVDGETGGGLIGQSFGPFEYVEVVRNSVRVDEGMILAFYVDGTGLWTLTEFAGRDVMGQRYSDLTISTTAPREA